MRPKWCQRADGGREQAVGAADAVTDSELGQSFLDDALATGSLVKYRKETDKEILDQLNSGKTIKVYRACRSLTESYTLPWRP